MTDGIDLHLTRATIHIIAEEGIGEPRIESSAELTRAQKGSTLHLKADDRSSITLTLTLPLRMRLVKIHCGAGAISIQHVESDNAQIDLGHGNMDGKFLRGTWDVNIGYGRVDIDGASGHFDINAGSGPILCRAVEGRFDVDAGLGQIAVESGRGTFEINSGKGNIHADALSGTLKVNAGLGQISVANSAALDCTVASGMGAVSLTGGVVGQAEITTGIGKISVDCGFSHLVARAKQRGDILVTLPARQGCRIEASTDKGRVISSLDLLEVNNPGPVRGQRLVGRLAQGETTLDIRTHHGDISLSQPPADSISHRTEPAVPTVAPDPRAAVLDRLQQGQISVEEAGTMLDALGNPAEDFSQ